MRVSLHVVWINTDEAAQNGVGAFILQCKRLDFHYCDWAGSSKGMKYGMVAKNRTDAVADM